MTFRTTIATALTTLALLATTTSCTLPAPPQQSGSSKNSKPSAAPPAKDVKITDCAVNSTLGLPEAELTVRNRSSKTSDYAITIEFLDANGDRVAEGAASATNLRPGQKATNKATGDNTASGQVKCSVTKVDRWASV